MTIICKQWEHHREMFLKLHAIKNVLVYFLREFILITNNENYSLQPSE